MVTIFSRFSQYWWTRSGADVRCLEVSLHLDRGFLMLAGRSSPQNCLSIKFSAFLYWNAFMDWLGKCTVVYLGLGLLLLRPPAFGNGTSLYDWLHEIWCTWMYLCTLWLKVLVKWSILNRLGAVLLMVMPFWGITGLPPLAERGSLLLEKKKKESAHRLYLLLIYRMDHNSFKKM